MNKTSSSKMRPFKNRALSYSRLSRFEQCPLSFKFQYIEKRKSEPNDALRFGKMIHAVLERLVHEHVQEERTGLLNEDRAISLYQACWNEERLSGIVLFEEGKRIIESFVMRQGKLDAHDILAIEKEFHLKVGAFHVMGFIDRIDRYGEDGIEVIDYKTNRLLPSQEELDHHLQLSLYAVAAKKLFPWAKHIKLSLDMLRHDLRMVTERTDKQLEDALLYIETLGKATESTTEFEPKLSANCVYCDHRSHCPAYEKALREDPVFLCENLDDLEAVGKERKRVHQLHKILTAKKSELDQVIKTHLAHHKTLELDGTRFQMFHTKKLDYPLEPTVKRLMEVTGQSREVLQKRVGSIDKKKLDVLLKDLVKQKDKAHVSMLKAELESLAEVSHTSRLWAKEVRA